MSEQFSDRDNQQETNQIESSETLCKKFLKQDISVHRPTYNNILKFSTQDLGYYLAGLIEGDGYISPQNQIVIVFHLDDSSLAYSLKKTIGYGNIYKIKNKNAIKLVIANKLGVQKILELINGKLRLPHKLEQFLVIVKNYPNIIPIFNIDCSSLSEHYWLTGYSDADASFQIKILNRPNKKNPEIRLYYQVDSKYDIIIKQIKESFGGYLGLRKTQETPSHYHSTSFDHAKNLIKYFDKYQLQSTKYINFIKWRKAYLIIQEREHLTEKGQEKIKKLKESMNRNLNLEIKIKSDSNESY